MRVSVSVGNYAETAFRVPGLEMDVCSAEELCHCIRQNAFLLDKSFLNDGLLNWLGKECGLGDLARGLYPLVHKKGTLSAFVTAILRYVGFYDEQVIGEISQVLKQGAGLCALERRKNQIDQLVRNKRYGLGIREYDAMLEKWRQQEDAGEAAETVGNLAAKDFLARIWHNKGVAYAGLMLYDKAAECFWQAWELEGAEDCRRDYLAAKRLQLSEGEYVALMGERGDLYSHSLELERQMEQYEREWEASPEYLRLYGMRESRNYFEEGERLTLALKDGYRICQRSRD